MLFYVSVFRNNQHYIVAQWRRGTQWRSGAVAQWRNGAMARASDSRPREP